MRSDWRKVPFEDSIVKVASTTKIPKKSYLNEGKYPIISQEQGEIGGYSNDESALFKLSKPIVVFGDHTRVLKYIDFDFVRGADGLKILEPIDDLDPKFYYYQLQSIKVKELGYARHFRQLKDKMIAIPPSDEQKEIVRILDEAFAEIDKAQANIEKNIQNAEDLFKSKLNQIFSQKDNNWESLKLGDACELLKRGIAPKYSDDGLIVINQKCIRNHRVSLNDSRFHNAELNKVAAEKIVKLGDVLVNSTGVGTLGRVAQVRSTDVVGATVDTHVTIVRPIPNIFYIDYFGYVMIYIEEQIQESGAGASGQIELSRKSLADDFVISVPPIEEQKEIVRILDGLSELRLNTLQNFKKQKANLGELKKSLLQKAFSGALTADMEK